ncbi:YadA C-terminal domain-containing protein [Photobacterium leiognathi]|uniref:YadA C-terminal domain-containing protein n=1 Tax=Photobacterium leiognathi TaxID=553611 RepID=UPI0029813E99|nr:YadA-like family protein [Photobacterium leiognathi]
MKKLLLATMITSTSFGAAANSEAIPTVDEKIAFINGHMANVGEGNASLIRDKDGDVKLTFTDQVSGETRHINMSELTEDQVAVITSEARNYYDENKNGVVPIVPTVDEKIEMVNQKFADLGLSAHVTESANGQSYLVYGDGESILLNDLDAEGIADIKARATEAITDDQIENPISPIDPGFGVDPIIPTVDEKIAFINGHMANVGEGNASLIRDKNGNVQLTFTDQVSGETRQINMSELTEDQVAVITSEARNYYDENKNGVAPIVPTVDEKIDMVNQKFADLGLSAHVTESANGQSYLVYGDGESILLNDLDAEGIVDIKARATEAIKDDQIENPISPIDPGFGVDPIDPGFDVDPIKTPGEHKEAVKASIEQKITELKETYTGENGKKVIDGIEDKVAELKETYTGENGKKVIDGIEDKVAELKEDYTGENGKKVVDGLEDKVAELKSTYTGDNGHAAKQSTTDQLSAIYKSQAETDSRQDSAISTNAAGIKENKEAITFLNAEIDRLDNKMDGVMAGVHAVNNARPYLTAQGQTAIGAGVGFAGSNSAVAVGLAHAVSDNWSVSATMNVTTGDESELSGGFGTQFTF